MTTVISVENLGKKYTLHHQERESYTALRDVLANGAASIGQKLLHPFRKASTNQQTQEDFWALKDVSFEVKQGDRIGIIGRNGAGKSTLLKILSRITEPTSGRVKIKGRVASLLEVGTGFHPELTGRENIYLNGAILGMSRIEIKKKFDEIVDFAEIEKFLDTPVKRYSSGMYVRLAFAVAAHLEPEILVVDEVLAVGDVQFQKKCLGKMGEVAQGGRTVLFVSHNMAAVAQLSQTGVLLDRGNVASQGKITSVIDSYHASLTIDLQQDLSLVQRKKIYKQKYARIISCEILDKDLKIGSDFFMNDTVIFRVGVDIIQPMNGVEIGIGINSASNVAIHYLHSSWSGHLYDLEKGRHTFLVKFLNIMLFPNDYTINCYVTKNSRAEHSDDAVFGINSFRVFEKDITGMFSKLMLNNTFSHYANSGCEVYVRSEWTRVQ